MELSERGSTVLFTYVKKANHLYSFFFHKYIYALTNTFIQLVQALKYNFQGQKRNEERSPCEPNKNKLNTEQTIIHTVPAHIHLGRYHFIQRSQQWLQKNNNTFWFVSCKCGQRFTVCLWTTRNERWSQHQQLWYYCDSINMSQQGGERPRCFKRSEVTGISSIPPIVQLTAQT